MQKKILIVDDDEDLLEIISFLLEEEGYGVTASATGEETKDLSGINPDLILLDLRLAGTFTSGEEICARPKADPATKELPVILISAEPDIKSVAQDCGADGYIQKPFDIFNLSEKIRSFF